MNQLNKAIRGVEVVELIGQGGMGAVYKARQFLLNRIVALKVLPHTAADGKSVAQRFEREARVLARLGHPNIVGIHEFGMADEWPFFTMDFVEGQTLRQLLKTGKVDPKKAVEFFFQLCDGLQHAHERGVIHRDIKPENILLDRQGRAKIADFGIAQLDGDREAGVRPTLEWQRVGTPHYMAPEQVEQPQAVGHRADIYAAGVVLYEMLTGELPIGRFAAPSTLAKTSRKLDTAIFKALEKNPKRRHPKIDRFKRAVEAALTGRPSGSTRLERSQGTATLERELRRLGQILATEPEDIAALQRQKDIYARLNREDDFYRTSVMLSTAYRRQGRWASAILENQHLLLRLPPDSPQAKALRHDTSALNAQLFALEKLAELRPSDYRFLEMLKRSYALLDIDDKRERFSRRLAEAYVLREKWSEAMAEYREILQSNPEDAQVRDKLRELEARRVPDASPGLEMKPASSSGVKK